MCQHAVRCASSHLLALRSSRWVWRLLNAKAHMPVRHLGHARGENTARLYRGYLKNSEFLGRHRLGDDTAVEEVDSARGVMGVARVVGDHADGGAVLVEFLEMVHYGFAVFGVEITCRLVGKEI